MRLNLDQETFRGEAQYLKRPLGADMSHGEYGVMSVTSFRLAASACFLSALLGTAFLPSFVFTDSQLLQIGIPVVSLGLYAFFMSAFGRLLTGPLGVPGTRLLIPLLIAGHLGLVVASVLDEISLSFLPFSVGLVLASSVAVGLLLMILGVRLFQVRKATGPVGLVLSILLIAQGICFASVVWISAAILIAVAADVALGILFLTWIRPQTVASSTLAAGF